MVGRAAAEPQGRPNKYTDVGVVGRKTGLMVKDTGRRDSAGLEDMDAFFSPAVEKSPRKSGISPRGKIYRTKLQAAMQSDDSVPMEGTSSSIRDPREVLASRKSLLAQSRTPQKTFLKSPAVRVQTPKRTNLESPSRVKRLISFTELDTDFEPDEGMLHGMGRPADLMESPTEHIKPTKRKGLTQQIQKKQQQPVEVEEEVPAPVAEDYEDQVDYGAGFADESLDFGANDSEEEEQVEVEEQIDVIEETEAEEEPEELEEDVEPLEVSSPLVKKGRGRPKGAQKAASSRTTKGKGKQTQKKTSSQPLPKRARTTSAQPRSPTRIRERKEIPQASDFTSAEGEVRRSTRIKVPPLAHWKNERIVYELESRRASGPALPRIKEIVRIDTPPQPQRPRARSVGLKRKSRADSDSESEESDAGEVYAAVRNYEDDSIIEDYKIAVSRSAFDPQPLQGNKVRFEKCFQDGAYVASGIMDIAVGGQKGAKPTRHAFMNFAVLSGKVEVKVNRTAFIMGKGGIFVVPRGNFYSIKNVGDKDCRLFFSQAVQEVLPEPDKDEDN